MTVAAAASEARAATVEAAKTTTTNQKVHCPEDRPEFGWKKKQRRESRFSVRSTNQIKEAKRDTAFYFCLIMHASSLFWCMHFDIIRAEGRRAFCASWFGLFQQTVDSKKRKNRKSKRQTVKWRLVREKIKTYLTIENPLFCQGSRTLSRCHR